MGKSTALVDYNTNLDNLLLRDGKIGHYYIIVYCRKYPE